VRIGEAGRTFPGSLTAVDSWVPPWTARPKPAAASAPVASGPVASLLAAHPDACDAVAGLLGCEGGWRVAGAVADEHQEVSALLAEHPEPVLAVAGLLL
jgi:hypothetical protein